MSLILNYTAASDRGLVRDNNEDSAYAGPNLLVLADGMGGHAAGEVASQIMVKQMVTLDRNPGDNDMLALLGGLADDANREISQTVRERPETEGMGTTLTAVLFDGQKFGLIHAGDSRGYRIRGNKLEQITVDDTYVQTLVDDGKLNPDDVSSHPHKSLILKAFTGSPVKPSLSLLDAQPGDRLLLCSDGLSDPVTASTIEEALGTGTPAVAAQRLVELALRSGGPDNITVVVADIVEDDNLDDAARAELPTQAATAGALAGDLASPTHPDTAAGRAAALSSRPQVIPAQQRAVDNEAATLADPDDEDEDEEPHRSRRWISAIIALVVLLAIVGTGWWLFSRIDDNYFVATNADDEFVIEQGVDYSVFGRDLHEPLQQACINEEGDLRFVDVGGNAGAAEDCTPFEMNDLPESVRGSVDALESGSYDTAAQHMQRLADEALPVCLTLESESEPGQPAAGEGDLTQPGINCREV